MRREQVDLELAALLRRHPSEELTRLVPCLVLEALLADPATEIAPPLLAIIQEWLASRGLGPSSSPRAILAELEATYRERPISQDLRLSLEELGRAAPPPRALFGGGRPLPPASAPPGALKASPLARFLLNTKP